MTSLGNNGGDRLSGTVNNVGYCPQQMINRLGLTAKRGTLPWEHKSSNMILNFDLSSDHYDNNDSRIRLFLDVGANIYRSLNLFVNPQSESGCLVLQLWAFLLFMTIITGSLSLLKCEMLELRALFSWKRADGETKARYHVTVTASGFAADEWGISNQRESEGWLTDTARLQTVKLIPWEIFRTQLKRVLVIKEQIGSSDAEIQQHCRTAGQLHVSD